MGMFERIFHNSVDPLQFSSLHPDVMRLHRATDEEISAAWPSAISHYQLQTNPDGMPVITADLLPRAKPEWVKAYHDTLQHDIYGSRIYGHPGSGLAESGFGRAQVKAGSKGEEVFAKLLSWDGVLNRCVSFWSVWNVEENGDRNSYGTDIDCILKFGNHIILVDVKNYRAGLDYHTLVPGHAMFCVYPVARVVANDPYVFSCNMGIAQQNLSAYLASSGSNCTVESYVVLVPGQAGEAVLDSDICWPGGIPAMSYSSFVVMIRQRFNTDPSFASMERTAEEGYLASLVKLYGQGKVLKLDEPAEPNQWPKPTCDKSASVDYPNLHGSHSTRKRDNFNNQREQSRPASGRKTSPSPKPRQTNRVDPTRSTSYMKMIPVVDVASGMAVTCGHDEDGNDASIQFKRVSCLTIEGTSRSGEVSRTFALIAALESSPNVNLRIIDCKRTSQFSAFSSSAYSYTCLTDGIDLVLDEIQGAYTALNVRLRKLRKIGVAGYWDDPNHGGLPLDVVFIHGCEDLFAGSANADDSIVQQELADILRYLRDIVKKGVDAGCCVVLSSQNPSDKAFPEMLVELAQTRILYRIERENQVRAFLAGLDTDIVRRVSQLAMSIGERDYGTAYVVSGEGISPKTRFMALDSHFINERYRTG